MRYAILGVLFLAVSPLAHADAVRFICSFDTYASPDKGLVPSNPPFVLEYVCDTVTNDGFLIGNNGTSPVLPVVNTLAVTFLEVLPTGAVQSMTMERSAGVAVHSRHTVLMAPPNGADLVPSQYYGRCTQQ